MSRRPRAIILGGYGLIGSALMRALRRAGFDVTGVGRSARAAQISDPAANWLIRDISSATAADWARDLADYDVVVNASGALQDGTHDDLAAIHHYALQALTQALKGSSTRFIQISAVGVSPKATTAFMKTKAAGDAVLMATDLNWIILRPSLVLAPAAYGGTALLRAVAAIPLVGIRVLPDTPVQTVAIDDLATAVVHCAQGQIQRGTLADITAADIHSFAELTQKMREWLGFPRWKTHITLPFVALTLTGKVADALGHLGWRAPLRSTALTVLQDGITGDPASWIAAGGTPCRPLAETLSAMPATVQDRWFARLFILFPCAIGLLSIFWLASGLIGIAQAGVAQEVLTSRGFGTSLSVVAVWVGAVADIALGAAILWRKWTRPAALGMIALSLSYLGMGTAFTPELWIDPLGPFLKVLPGIGLAACVAALTEDR